MREDHKPGDLSARISFGRVMGNGPDSGKIRPSLSITCETSGLNLELDLTPEQLTEMLSGGAAQIAASKVSGFRGLARWGKYHQSISRTVATRVGDYSADPTTLQYVMEKVHEIEAEGYKCDTPRRNNKQQWVITGRRYVEKP